MPAITGTEAGQATRLLADQRFRRMQGLDSDRLLGRKPGYAQGRMSRDFTTTWQQVFPDRPRRTLYNLKDTFAVRFLYSPGGGNINELANILGHASLDTTRRYLKAVPYGTRLEGTIWDYPDM